MLLTAAACPQINFCVHWKHSGSGELVRKTESLSLVSNLSIWGWCECCGQTAGVDARFGERDDAGEGGRERTTWPRRGRRRLRPAEAIAAAVEMF